jgi:hypothetical protein
MKKLILASLALLMVAAGPAMAGEFQALSKLSVPGQTSLSAMTDKQLAAVEGQSSRRRGRNGSVQVAVGNVLVNTVVAAQFNTCVACANVLQANGINQSNSVND